MIWQAYMQIRKKKDLDLTSIQLESSLTMGNKKGK